MYIIGDKIVYPMHGAGVVEGIEEKKILGETRRYYVLKLPCGDMKVMIPIEASGDIGVRKVMSKEAMEDMMDTLHGGAEDMPSNWNRRYRENMDKLKSGNALAVAEVVRNLARLDQSKKLSTGEKKMLANARQILLSEIIMVKGVEQKEADDIIDRLI